MIRPIRISDIPECVLLYNRYITETTVTFEFDPLTEEQFCDRVRRITQNYPYYVYEDDETGAVLGYAYLDCYSERKAYRFTSDLSIYLAMDARGRGIGRALYEAIEAEAYRRGFYTVVAIVTSENAASMAFHEAMGFVKMADFENMGNKFGRWLGVRYYRKNLRTASPDIPAEELQPQAQSLKLHS